VRNARKVDDPRACLEVCASGRHSRRFTSPINSRDTFIAAENWRGHHAFPAKVSAATQPFSELIGLELVSGSGSTLSPRSPERDAYDHD
jgi:hypothetical protein